MIEQKLIEPVTEPTDCCSAIVVVPKKDPGKVRVCPDLTKVNKFVKKERYQSKM